MPTDPMTNAEATELAHLISRLRAQETRLVFTRFTHEDAWQLGSLLVGLAGSRGLGVTVNITKGDQQVFHAALAGTTADNDDWVARKTRTVVRFEHSSFLVGRLHAAAGTDFSAATGLPLSLYAAHGGCFPIRVPGVGLVGTVAVSGLPQEDDHALVVEAVETFLR